MRTFRTLEQSKKNLQVIQEYIDLIEKYEPKTYVQHVIHTYVTHGSIIKAARF